MDIVVWAVNIGLVLFLLVVASTAKHGILKDPQTWESLTTGPVLRRLLYLAVLLVLFAAAWLMLRLMVGVFLPPY